MFTNIIKVTLRTLYREKIYATINIAGLSIAIACCIILGLYIRSELTYDRHNLKHKQIYRIVKQQILGEKLSDLAMVPHLLGPFLKKDFPDVKEFVRFTRAGETHIFRYEGNAFYWKNTYYADKSVFDVFTHRIVYGDPGTSLTDATSIAVSESFSRKYFGGENPVGKLISDDAFTYKIKVVFADIPENTHLKYDVLLPYRSNNLNKADAYNRSLDILYRMSDYTYLLMPEEYDIKEFDMISDSIYNRYIAEKLKKITQMWRCWLQPLSDTHFNTGLAMDLDTVNYYYLYGFIAVAVFIILVACINYINLAIARASKRAKEVGMRKVLGSGRKNLIIQFIGESVFFSLFALFLGLAMAEACLKLTSLNELLGKSLSLDFMSEPALFLWMFLISLCFGIISGIYPALHLSSIRPVSAMPAQYKIGKYSIRLRELLVLIQFIISICIIICTLVMFMQMHYIANKPLGFKKENRLIVTLRGADLIDKVPVIKNEILKNKDIIGASLCSSIIGKSSSMMGISDGKKPLPPFYYMRVDKDFIKVMGLELSSGSDFTEDSSRDYILNEAMAREMGWEEPIGKRYFPGNGSENAPGKVIGVVKDFHISSLYDRVGTFMFQLFHGTQNYSNGDRQNMIYNLVINLNTKNKSKTIKYLEKIFEEFDSEHPFEFRFLDDILNQMYFSDQHLMKLIGIFAIVCILISCLGLFGLTAFSTEQRTKEIGTRKVLGATTWQIITIFSKRILLLVLAGAVFASLGAYYAMDEWLTRFAFKIDIELWVFFVSTTVVALLAFIAVAAQAFSAAQANPVKALRYE